MSLAPISKAGGMVGPWSAANWSRLIAARGEEAVVSVIHEIKEETGQPVSASAAQSRLDEVSRRESRDDERDQEQAPMPRQLPSKPPLLPIPTPPTTPNQDTNMQPTIDRLKAAMKERRLTRQEVADSLHVSVTSIDNWTGGRSSPSQATAVRIEAFLSGAPVPAPKLAEKLPSRVSTPDPAVSPVAVAAPAAPDDRLHHLTIGDLHEQASAVRDALAALGAADKALIISELVRRHRSLFDKLLQLARA